MDSYQQPAKQQCSLVPSIDHGCPPAQQAQDIQPSAVAVTGAGQQQAAGSPAAQAAAVLPLVVDRRTQHGHSLRQMVCRPLPHQHLPSSSAAPPTNPLSVFEVHAALHCSLADCTAPFCSWDTSYAGFEHLCCLLSFTLEYAASCCYAVYMCSR